MTLPVNTLLAQRFLISQLLQEGGMGAIYLATDLTAGRVCVVKEMLDRFADPQEREKAIQTFHREADMLEDLRHPQVPEFYGHFTEDDRHYLAMEYVEGSDLEALLEHHGQPFSEEEVVGWGIQVCEVLDYLHRRTPPVIYRDLKPANLMLAKDGRVMMVDFGIARFFNPIAVGTMIGTPGYAPPEQYQGLAEPRSDLYLLAATMHHLLTGRDPRQAPPFRFPPVTSLRPDVSPQLDAILQRALEMDPDLRYQTATEVLNDLKTYKTQPPTKATHVLPEAEAPKVKPSTGPTPVLAVDVRALDFGKVPTNGGPVTRSFVITNPVAASRHSVRLKGSVDTNQPWLTVDLSAFNIGNEMATVQVSLDPTSLTHGRHSGAVTVTSSGGSQTITVLVDVTAPVLKVTPDRLDLGQVSRGQVRETALFVANVGTATGTLVGTVKSDQPWIRVATPSFRTMDRHTIPVHVCTSGLPAGLNTGHVTVETNGGRAVIEVSLSVIAPRLQVTPAELDFGDLMRKQKRILSLKVSNVSEGIMEGQLLPGRPWITCATDNFKTSGSTLVEIMVDAPGDKAGQTVMESLEIQSTGGTAAVPIRLNVLPAGFLDFLSVWWANRNVRFKPRL